MASLIRNEGSFQSVTGMTYKDHKFDRLHALEPRLGIFSVLPSSTFVNGTHSGTLEESWSAISDFVGNIYNHLVRSANQDGLAISPTDLASGVEAAVILDYLSAGSYLRPLAALLKTSEENPDESWLQTLTVPLWQRRQKLWRLMKRWDAFALPDLYSEIIDNTCQPVTAGPQSMIFMALPNVARTTLDLASTTEIDSLLNYAGTHMDSMENTADKLKFLNALQSYKPSWAHEHAVTGVVVDAERVLQWRTAAVRRDDPVAGDGLQSPNLEDSDWGDGTELFLFHQNGANKFFDTGMRQALTYEKNDFAAGDFSYGTFSLQSATGDSAQKESQITIFDQAGSAAVHQNLGFDLDPSDLEDSLWPSFLYAKRVLSEATVTHQGPFLFDEVFVARVTLDEVAYATRKLLVEAWGIPT